MADRVDEDHTRQMEAGLKRLDDHIDEAESKKAYVDSKAQRAGDAIEGGPEHGGAEATLSGGGSTDPAGGHRPEGGPNAGEEPGGADDGSGEPSSRPNGEVEEEQANPS